MGRARFRETGFGLCLQCREGENDRLCRARRDRIRALTRLCYGLFARETGAGDMDGTGLE